MYSSHTEMSNLRLPIGEPRHLSQSVMRLGGGDTGLDFADPLDLSHQEMEDYVYPSRPKKRGIDPATSQYEPVEMATHNRSKIKFYHEKGKKNFPCGPND